MQSSLWARTTKLFAVSGAIMFSLSGWTDITEIPAEEMTEAYIRDTTVIISKQAPQDAQTPATEHQVKISPSAVPVEINASTDPNNAPHKRPDLEPLTDKNLAQQQELSLQQRNSQVVLPNYDASQKERDDNLRKILQQNNIALGAVGVPATGPIDYSQLSFPTSGLPALINPQPGTSFTPASGTFIINVPVTGANTNGIQNLTPGGEFQMQINNGQLQFIINRPQP